MAIILMPVERTHTTGLERGIIKTENLAQCVKAHREFASHNCRMRHTSASTSVKSFLLPQEDNNA